MPELSIISASVDSPEWAELLVKSVRKFTSVEHEIIIIDNGSLPVNLKWLETQEDVNLIKLSTNIGHGGAMDLGTALATFDHICFLDIDAHVQRKDWDSDLFSLYLSNPLTRLIGVVGPEQKPLHPPLFFYKKSFVSENNIYFKYVPRLSTDTAQKAYWDILNLGFKVERLEKGPHIYTCDKHHDEIWLGNPPQATMAHAWYGTRFCENNPQRKKLALDGYKLEDHLKRKTRFFQESLVLEILSSS